jgi:transposase InsO family protein
MELPMKKQYGVPMNTYGHILPGAEKISKIYSLSKEARQRLLWIDHYTKHRNGRLTCRYFGIAPKTFYKWFKRYGQRGARGLEAISTKPHKFRESKIPLSNIDRVIHWRKLYPIYSKYKIAVLLKREDGIMMSPSAIGRVIKKYKLFFPSAIPAKKQRYRQAAVKQRLHPYYRSKLPGELGEADMKHVSFFGQRRYFFVGIDCVSKRLAVHVGTNSSSIQASRLLEKMKSFPFPIEKVRVDNGGENQKDFALKAESLNIGQYFARYRRPKDKPFVERVIGTIEREFIQQGKLAIGLEDQRQLVDEWVEHYNTFRPHQSLNYLTPEAYESRLKQVS